MNNMCKHEYRQKFIDALSASCNHYLIEDGYYCIYCLKHEDEVSEDE